MSLPDFVLGFGLGACLMQFAGIADLLLERRRSRAAKEMNG